MALKVLLVRHALAEEREVFRQTGLPDSARPLVVRGERQMKEMAKALRQLVDGVDIIGTSPYVRARQTADILQKYFKRAGLFEMQELTPQTSPLKTLRAIQKIGRAEMVILVGHEPHLGRFLSFVLTGSTRNLFDIKKGGAALIEFSGRIEKKQAKLKCFLQPSQVKKIRRK